MKWFNTIKGWYNNMISKTVITNLLENDEKIVWEGGPQPDYKMIYIEKASLSVLIFSLVMLFLSLTIIENFGFLSIAASFCIISSLVTFKEKIVCFFYRRCFKYVITNLKIYIIVSRVIGYAAVHFYIADIKYLEKRNLNDGCGNIEFDRYSKDKLEKLCFYKIPKAFISIKKPDEVFVLINSIRKQQLPK